jgi:hypothetical protein
MEWKILYKLEATVATILKATTLVAPANILWVRKNYDGFVDQPMSFSPYLHLFLLGATIGNDSCIGISSCLFFNNGTIGDSSCYGLGACAIPPGLNYTGNIGDNSCNGTFTCTFYDASRDTGDNSCNGFHACTDVTCEYS